MMFPQALVVVLVFLLPLEMLGLGREWTCCNANSHKWNKRRVLLSWSAANPKSLALFRLVRLNGLRSDKIRNHAVLKDSGENFAAFNK